MTNKKEDSHNFWSGFAVGTVAGTLLLYGFATKKGRETVKKLLDQSDTIEHNFEDILKLLKKRDILNLMDDSQDKK